MITFNISKRYIDTNMSHGMGIIYPATRYNKYRDAKETILAQECLKRPQYRAMVSPVDIHTVPSDVAVLSDTVSALLFSVPSLLIVA